MAKELISGLYIIATPIGNLKDITLRALETLEACDVIYCEDTRVTGKLLAHYNIKKNLKVYNDHSTEYNREKIYKEILEDKKIVLVSDAGTPLIADPGYKLVKFLREKGVAITSLPGSCSLITALTLSAAPSDKFTFIGFLPKTKGQLENTFKEIIRVRSTFIAFETAKRLKTSLTILKELNEVVQVSVVREITKLFEEVISGSTGEVLEKLAANPDKIRGEIVLIINSSELETESDSEEIRGKITDLATKYYTTKEIVEYLKSFHNISRNQAYKLIMEVVGK
ncbi:16S rRNA (cytidine(1402)-2'-O)-methyltransferase [Rickettsiales endosymbiont of Stachyamoeba lipophora]|uniref:16S rRNA (cytidine(1402)-2'-O)-methyltransferase n=1 Tax=Rickettsiales endosymbiont of Stachyamoeba lipophora TaxID=2486578 RepID=UPI000F653D59|nr:16S rRNA (cytidine(1402)-2'-O)-methyltransferase [Rickettsiales endosymbiont of Stachyamoeba lipophora]AZL15603.1 16S rRNA (cytidine(1402)-2'-O)-methyltransferase [Rickettsiales endosymbiont of Stachyamoeba lipophora]